jgi:hypothetical protein
MAAPVFDHVMMTTPDLNRTMAEIAERTGVRAGLGGEHAGMGTHNALLGLGDGRYLEILGPVPGHENDSPFAALVAAQDMPRNFLWAVRTDDIEAFVRDGRAAGYDPGAVADMSRTMPDGQILRWRLTMGGADVIGSVLPFGIQWLGDRHPADSAPGGCTLATFRAEHPEPGRMGEALDALRVDVALATGPAPALIAVLDTPRGRVALR